MRNDLEYFRQRARQARKQAASADTPSIRMLHLRFAEHYERAVVTAQAKDASSAA